MRDFLRRFAPYLKDYKPRLALAALAGIVAAIANAGVYWLIQPVMDGVFIEGDKDLHRILPPVIVAIFFFYGLGRFVQTYEISWIGEDIVRRIRDRLLRHIVTFDLGFFNAFRGGELIARVTNDITRVRIAISQHLAVIARESLMVVGLLAVVVYSSPRLAFWGLVVLPTAAWPITMLARRVKKFAHRSQEKDSDITSRLAEIFNNMEIIKAHHSETFELERFEKDNLEFRRINMKVIRARIIVNPLMELLGAVAIALVIWFGGSLVISGKMKPGEFVRFMTALFALYTPIKRISTVYNQMFEAVAASDRIFDMLSRTPAIRCGEKFLDEPIGEVEFDDVSLSYGETEALRGISLVARKGEMVALVGDSGGGKSSLVNLLPRLYDPDKGRLLINGIDSRELDFDSLRARIGVVTQRVYVFNDSVAANVAYGLEIDRTRVESALKRAGAWEFVESMEDGVFTVLEEFGANLSGGQRQRLAIARALYREPQILILDEATSALDNRSEAAIQRALEEVTKDCITFVIAHRLSTVDLADRILVVQGGKVVAEGTKVELIALSPEYRRLAAGDLPD
ncbi:MAG: ABC transporter ATP-binding protein/permease [Thermoanaerobaculales bacterium]|nr:ABC transporter ATP-binding protein/permease [Thermoanaerobaculales bacterium]